MAKNWNVGDPCRVIYTEDGKAYDAVIEDLNNEESFAVVYFVSWPESKQVLSMYCNKGYSINGRNRLHLI